MEKGVVGGAGGGGGGLGGGAERGTDIRMEAGKQTDTDIQTDRLADR